MKIAVMGMGVAGSYLMARLKNSEHEVVGYERMVEEKHDSICAWGTIKKELNNFCKKDIKRYSFRTNRSKKNKDECRRN